MLVMSRKCVPYTPVSMKLSEMTVALVSSTGVYLEGQQPFGDDTDSSYRILPGDLSPTDLRFKHGHYDESQAQQDANTVFPIQLLQEMAQQGIIRRVGNKNIGFRGFSTNLKLMYEEVAPAIAAEIERSQAEGVLLTGGCPVCHRVVVAVQREIEAKGIPTVLITAVPAETKMMRPPRSIYPVGSKPGHVLGSAGDREKQFRVLAEALRQFEVQNVPGATVEFEAAGVLTEP
jgi:D-proline reductase (dithiol) PrdB